MGRDVRPALGLLLGLCLASTPADTAPSAPALPDHWLGSLSVKAEPGETVRTREGPDFTVRDVVRDGRTLFSVYEGPAAAVDGLERKAIRRACGITFYRLSAKIGGQSRNVGYYGRIGNFDVHLFGDSATGERRALKAFERRILFPRC